MSWSPDDAVGFPSLTFEWHGALVAVRSPSDELLDALRRALPNEVQPHDPADTSVVYTWTLGEPNDEGHRFHTVVRQSPDRPRPRSVVRTRDLTTAIDLIVHDAEFRVAIYAPERLFIHAASVAWEGRVIVIPGYSRAGKSTLTASLVRAGALYFSDEYTVIDEAGLIHPFPRRLHMRSRTGGPSREVPVAELGGVAGTEPLPMGLVVSTYFRRGAQWRPRPLSPGGAALELFDNAIVGRVRPDHTMTRIAQALALGACAITTPRGDADKAARKLLALASQAFAAAYDAPVPLQAASGW